MSKTNLLEQLFELNYATREISLSKNLPTIVVRTISSDQQADLEEELKEYAELTQRQFYQKYAIAIISRTLISWGTNKFPDVEGWKEFLKEKPLAIIQKVIQEQEALEKDVRAQLKIEGVQESFFPEEESPGESKH